MLFNSLEFLLFFPIVTLLFYILPHQFRWVHLLIASCIFYTFFIPQYIFILFITIIIDYIAGIWIERSSARKKKIILVASIVSTCLVLFIFKYFDFFNQNMLALSQEFGFYYPEKTISFLMPIGLSFHTFQSLSYVIEVYRGKQKAEKHFGTAQEEVLTMLSKVDVVDGSGNSIGRIEQEFLESIGNLLEGQNVYSVYDGSGKLVAKSKADNFIKNDVDIYDNSGDLVARFHKPAVSYGDKWRCEIVKEGIDKRLLIFIPCYLSSSSSSSSSKNDDKK